MNTPSHPPTGILSPEEETFLAKFRRLDPESQGVVGNLIAAMAENPRRDRTRTPLHHCTNPGLLLSTFTDWDVSPDEFIPDVLTSSAVHQVLSALEYYQATCIRDRAPVWVRHYHRLFLEAVERGDEDVANQCARKRNWWLDVTGVSQAL